MNLTDSRLAQAGNERLELAMLSFFEQFRKIYIGDQVQKSSKVSTRFNAAVCNVLNEAWPGFTPCRPPASVTLHCLVLTGGQVGGDEQVFCPEHRGVC